MPMRLQNKALEEKHSISFNNVEIIDREKDLYKRLVLEMFHITT